MMKLIRPFLILLFLHILSPVLSAQESKIKSIGIPLIESFGASDYGFGSQNFDVLMGNGQRMYFANYSGVMIYDGTIWTKISLPKNAGVYSIAKASDGTIYVGGINEFGYLKTNNIGLLEYESLKPKLKKNINNYVVWFTDETEDDHIIFTTTNFLIKLDHDSKEVQIIDCPGAYWRLLKSRGELYSYQGDSLFYLKDSTWQVLRKSAVMSDNKNKALIVDIDNGKSIVITDQGFYDFQTDEKIPVGKEVISFLSKGQLRGVSLLKNRFIAICGSEGILITDFNGKMLQLLNKEKGLTASLTYKAAVDEANQVWVVTNNGIDKVELFSPYSLLNSRMGVEGIVGYVNLFEGNLYLSTSTGLYNAPWEELHMPEIVPSFNRMSSGIGWQLLQSDGDLLALFTGETMVINNDAIQQRIKKESGVFWRGAKFESSNDVLIGSSNGGLDLLQKSNGKWITKKNHKTQFPPIHQLVKESDSIFWFSENTTGLYKIAYNTRNLTFTYEKFGAEAGLPADNGNSVFEIGNKPIVATIDGLYRFNSDKKMFSKDSILSPYINNDQVVRVYDDDFGNIYYYSHGFNILKKRKNGYQKLTYVEDKIGNYFPQHIEIVDTSNVLLSTYDAILHINPNILEEQKKYSINLSKMSLLGTPDSVIHGGFGALASNLKLPYQKNDLRFEFSSTFYQDTDKTQYKWKLNGFDDTWSNWSSETQKDYTNIPHGEYSFQVRAKNVYGIESDVSTFNFSILPPWYFTVWAYIAYSIGFILFMRVAFKLNARRLENDKKRLEGIVEARTKTITEQKEQAEMDAETISSQHDKLRQMDELKSRFFLNISHELRTPLTLTMGTVDQTIKGKFGSLNDEQYANLKVSYRNSERLLKMVNNILDISKLEGGKMQLYASLVKPKEILNKVVDFFASKFHDKKVELNNTVKSDVELYLDKDKFETVFINLIANAFKFTPAGGEIRLSLQETEESVIFHVKDTGVGIPTSDIPFVFDRFYQSAHTKSGEGTGVGLALSKELVELHKGHIEVNSEVDQGTEFSILLPKGRGHLEESQIIEHGIDQPFRIMEDKYPMTDALGTKEKKELEYAEQLEPSEKAHILIVEDNYEMSKYVQQILQHDYLLSMVEDGKQGLDFLKKNKPDLILTDYLMPVMDGFEMANEIKKNDDLALIPMVFLTARAQEQDKIDVLNLGVDDYIFKPFNAEELKVRIANLLNFKQQRAEYWIEKSIDPRDIEWKEFPSKLKLDIDKYIEEHIKEEITSENLTEFTGQSERSLYRKVKVNTGMSLMQYIKEYRLRKARGLLENKMVLSVSDAAYAVGLNHLSHFTKSFKERFGKSPSDYLDK